MPFVLFYVDDKITWFLGIHPTNIEVCSMICNSRNKLSRLGIDAKDSGFKTYESDIGDNKMVNIHTNLIVPLFKEQ